MNPKQNRKGVRMNYREELFLSVVCDRDYQLDISQADIQQQIKKNRIIDTVLRANPEAIINGLNWDKVNQNRIDKFNEVKKLIGDFNALNISYIFIKGIALLDYYPKDTPRQSNDFDIIVESIEHFWKCNDILFNRGFEFAYIPMLTEKNNSIKGVLKYKKTISDGVNLYIEININGFLISEVAWYNDIDIWENKKLMNYEGIDIPVPSHEMSIVFLIIEASGRESFFIRDALDFFYLTYNKEINWDYVEEKLKHKYLKNILSKFKNNNLFDNNHGLLSILKSNTMREIFHIIPAMIRERNMKKFFLRYGKYLGEKLLEKNKISLANQLQHYLNPYETFKNGLITHFYLLNSKRKSNKIKWSIYDGLYTCTCPAGTFFVSNLAILSEDDENKLIDMTKKDDRIEK